MQNYNLKFKVIASICLISLALIERLWLDLGPNIELITLVTFIAGFYLGKKWAIIIPLIVLAATDIFLGNTNIMLFTWSGYLVIGVGAIFFKKISCHAEFISASSFKNEILKQVQDDVKIRFKKINLMLKKTLFSTSGGVVASIWFYLWTNFGVWFLDSWGMYPKTLNGLITCYINGIPFFKNQLLSNLLIIPVGFAFIEISKYLIKSYRSKYLLNQA